MGGVIDRGQVSNFSYELPISQLKFDLKSNVIPIGMIKTGIHYHRALLFKVSIYIQGRIQACIWLVPKLNRSTLAARGLGARSPRSPRGFDALRCILSHSWHLKLFWLNYFSRNLIVFLVFLSHILTHSLLTTDLCNGFHNKRLICGKIFLYLWNCCDFFTYYTSHSPIPKDGNSEYLQNPPWKYPIFD